MEAVLKGTFKIMNISKVKIKEKLKTAAWMLILFGLIYASLIVLTNQIIAGKL